VIDNFYISTNGTISTDLFLSSVFELWKYCKSNIKSCLDISNDIFHDMDEINRNLNRLSIFSFTKFKYSSKESFPEYAYDYDSYDCIIGEGHGKRYTDKLLSPPDFKKQLEHGHPAEIYLNSKGNIVFGCDWSYITQDKYYLCHVNDLQKYIDKIIENNRKLERSKAVNCDYLRKMKNCT